MASFGSFETEREVYSDLVYTVYTARKPEDQEGEYAVKVFRLPDRGLEAEVAPGVGSRDELERARLSSIRVQAQAAEVSKFVAPILEHGNDAQGLWYATVFYPRSVNKLMSGKVALPRASLEYVVGSIAQGALDLKRACGRSHGDIRPTNIQVGKSERLLEADVVLCDPLPGGIEKAREYEIRDLHAIGLVLLQLVRRRMITADDAAAMFPIAPSPEWTKTFGSDASDWLAICNRLLDPHLDPEAFGLEALVARLQELKPKRKLSPRLIGACAAGLVLLIAAAVFLLLPKAATVEISSDPPGALVAVDGTSQSQATPLRLKLKKGAHTLQASLAQLELPPQVTNFVAESGSENKVHFQFPYGSVSIRSEPPGATISHDHQPMGVTPADGKSFVIPAVKPGSVTYEVSLAQYEPVEISGVVSNGETLALVATLPRKEAPPVQQLVAPTAETSPPPTELAKGKLQFRSDPVEATVFDSSGHELGRVSPTTPLDIELPPGSYSFTARADGLADSTLQVQVVAHTTLPQSFHFEYGTVNWISDSAPVTVHLGNVSRVTPATFIQKPNVASEYALTAPGFRSATNEVTVGSGQTRKISAQLKPLTIAISLLSDPPGAEFFSEDGKPLTRNRQNASLYEMPCGPVNLVAQHPQLGAITNHVELSPDQNGKSVRFQFLYGTLSLSNLPSEVTIYENEKRIGGPADQSIVQNLGPHLYTLRGPGTSETVQTNIVAGLNYLQIATAQKSWKNSFGMWFAWIPHLPGGGTWPGQNEPGGWVGLSEVTQAEYIKMDGSNPSQYEQGGGNCPVENLTWDQAMSYCRWLSSKDSAPRMGWRYTLPTENQFAFFGADADRLPRVTSEGRMSSSLDDSMPLQRGFRMATAANPNGVRTHPEPVASTKSNQFGLYDVVGNIWEWLLDPAGKDHICAGGGFLNFSQKTVGVRARERVSERNPSVGFRVILVPPQY